MLFALVLLRIWCKNGCVVNEYHPGNWNHPTDILIITGHMIKAHLSSTNQRQKDAPYMATSTTTVMSTGPHASLAAYSRQKATLVYAAVTHAHHLSW